MKAVADIGTVPWTIQDIAQSYDEFRKVYAERPIRDNKGGMLAPQAFAAWFLTKELKPTLIVESGVWKGQGTWLLEQASPGAEMICLDINLSRLEYRSPKATYIESDFSMVDFSQSEKEKSLCFFDDHQNAFRRIQEMAWKGFRTALFEDNYPPNRGDCYSLKKAIAECGFIPSDTNQLNLKRFLKRVSAVLNGELQQEIVKPNSTHRTELLKNLSVYYEFPPIYRTSHTRWGDKWNDETYPTKQPVFDKDTGDPLFADAQSYNWMCFVKLK